MASVARYEKCSLLASYHVRCAFADVVAARWKVVAKLMGRRASVRILVVVEALILTRVGKLYAEAFEVIKEIKVHFRAR
jgi:hypothetical protein